MAYVVSLRKENGQHFCGGGLISVKHVLTAAACIEPVILVENPEYAGIFVTVGTNSISEGGTQHLIKHLSITRRFEKSPVNPSNDIGLVTVSI